MNFPPEDQLEKDLDSIVAHLIAGSGWLQAKAVRMKAPEIKALARQILLPIYQDAYKWRANILNS